MFETAGNYIFIYLIGVDYKNKDVKMDGMKIELQIW